MSRSALSPRLIPMGSEFRSRFRSLLAPTRSAMLNQSYRNRAWKSSGAAKQGVARQPCRRRLDTGRRAMKAIVVTDQAAGTAGMTLVERPEPQGAINDVVGPGQDA